MKIINFSMLALLLSIILSSGGFSQERPERQWPSYRGYFSSGVLDNASLPEKFDFDKSENIRWKTDIPGMGISSPVIWGNKLFLTTAVSESDKAGFKPGLYGDVTPVSDSSVHEWKVFCINKITGGLSGKGHHTRAYRK